MRYSAALVLVCLPGPACGHSSPLVRAPLPEAAPAASGTVAKISSGWAIGGLAQIAGAHEMSIMKPQEAWMPLNRPALRMTGPRSIAPEAIKPASFLLLAGGSARTLERVQAQLRDPSLKLSGDLVQELGLKYALQAFPLMVASSGRTSVDHVTGDPRPDLTISVETVAWFLTCEGGSPICNATYHASLRMLDRRDERLLAAGDCQSTPLEPTLGRSDGGGYLVDVAGLQSVLDEAAESCLGSYLGDLFGIYRKAPAAVTGFQPARR